MRNFWTFNTDGNGVEKVREKIKSNLNKNLMRANKMNNNNTSNTINNSGVGNYNNLTHSILSSSLSNNNNFKPNNNNSNSSTISNSNITNSNLFSNYYVFMNPIFDISETFIVYYNNTSTPANDHNTDLGLKKENSANFISNKEYSKEKYKDYPCFNNYSSYKSSNLPENNMVHSASTTSNLASNDSKRNLNSNSSCSSNYSLEKSFRKVNKNNINTNSKNLKLDNINMKTFSPVKQANPPSKTFSEEVFTNISNLKDWSVNQIKDFYNLRSATNLNNNKDLKTGKNENSAKSNNIFSSTITIQKIIFEDNMHLKFCEERESREGIFNNVSLNLNKQINNKNINDDMNVLSTYLEKIKSHSTKINIPFFEDGISTLKFQNYNRYIIVGNKNSQMFFIYELYPQTNLKFSSDVDSQHVSQIVANSIFSIKIINSIYRGITSANINAIDLSTCKNFISLASNKGTFHVFELPKKDNQIIENTTSFDYKNFDLLNQKVQCAKDFNKIMYKKFLYNYTYKSACMMMNLDRIDVDRNFTTEMKEDLLKSKFSKTSKGTVLCTFTENESAIYFYYLNNNNKNTVKHSEPVYTMKKYEILSTEEKEEAERNFELIRKGKLINNTFYNNSAGNRCKSYFKENIELETTEKNFSILQRNPFFTFNVIKNQNSNKSSIKI